jgi:hypothetical protein
LGQPDEDSQSTVHVDSPAAPVPRPRPNHRQASSVETIESSANPDILAVNRAFSLFYRYSSMYYIEPSGVDAFYTGTGYEDYESGGLNGGGLGLSWMSNDLWYFHGEWSGVEGQVNYTGFDQGGNPVNATSRATVQDYDLKFGKGFSAGQDWMFTPYISFGGRYWVRELGLGTPYDYVESYKHYYWALGGMVQYSPLERVVITGDGAVGRTFSPTINSPQFQLNNTPLGSGPVIKLALDADYRVVGALHVFTGVDYMYFNYGQSGIQVGNGFEVLEPFSHTEVYTVTMGIRVGFNINELLGFRSPD